MCACKYIYPYRGANYNTSHVALYNIQHSFFERAMDLLNTQLSKISRNFKSVKKIRKIPISKILRNIFWKIVEKLKF